MTDKKKTYQQPKMEVEQLDQADIICTSTQATFGIMSDEGFDEDNW